MSALKSFFKAIWTGIQVIQAVLFILLFVLLAGIIIGAFSGGDQAPKIPEAGAALVFKLSGTLVEREPETDPFAAAFGDEQPYTLLRDVTRALDEAATDDRIKAVVLSTDGFGGGLPADIVMIGKAIEKFRAAAPDKKIISLGDGFGQAQYQLASYADEIYMHPYGYVFPTGYGSYRLFFRDLLDMLKVTVTTFTVGQFKSATEPFVRGDMSEPAKEANRALLDVLWANYLNDVTASRKLQPDSLKGLIDNAAQRLQAVGGDAAALAVEAKLVDGLMTRDEQRKYMIDLVGENEDKKTFNQVGYKSYLEAVGPVTHVEGEPKVAIVVAEGTIVPGGETNGVASANAVSALLKKAREDEDVKALVFRVNSPGGSAFASEVIRRELELVKEAGKPVVVSMGGVAASGGYWISMPADEIWASPTTITGSIGVAGIALTVENSIKEIGLNVDGVGTTEFAGSGIFGRPLTENTKAIFQAGAEDIYRKFITHVAAARKLSVERVQEIAQGRVWAGSTAFDLGLVDKLGELDDAIASAAKRADLSAYTVKYVEKEPTAFEQFLRSLSKMGVSVGILSPEPRTGLAPRLERLADSLDRAEILFSDPQQVYAICAGCYVE